MNHIVCGTTSSLNGSAILEYHLPSLAEVGAARCEHCHPKEFVNDKTLVAHCQILLLTNASKVPCRQVGVNSSSWQSTPPTSGLDNIKESLLPSPETKQSLYSFLQPPEQKHLLATSFFGFTDQCPICVSA